jgi:hypothetical protein
MSWNFLDSLPHSDPVAELPTGRLERAMAFRNGLVALCEGSAKMNDAVPPA